MNPKKPKKSITKQDQLFDRTDKIVKAYLRVILNRFRKVQRTLTFDELNIMNTINEEWEQLNKLMRDCLYEVVLYYYRFACDICQRDFDDQEAEMWFAKLIEQADPVTHYIYFPESDRKRARLIEGIFSVKKLSERRKQLDIAERYIARQITQTADDYTISSFIEGLKASGVKEVEWVTQQDEKVCEDCEPLDGQIFDMDDIPMLPQHYNCRCFIIPILN